MTGVASVGGDALKIWEFSGSSLDLRSTFDSIVGGSLGVAWNHTNQVVAVSSPSRISLVHAKTAQLLSSIPFSESPPRFKFGDVKFSLTSRYLASASDSSVLLWDLKSRALKSNFTNSDSPISSIGFILDSIVVSGSESGVVSIWDAKSNQAVSSMFNRDSSYPDPIHCLRVSPLGAAKVATGHSSGSLCVWDPKSSVLLRRQQLSVDPITGLSFSPKNIRLIASVSTGGKMSLVDIGTKQSQDPSASVDVGDRLTAISFHEDAIQCVVGTNSGYVLLYDWRNAKKPVLKLEAHSPYAVTAVEFQNHQAKTVSPKEQNTGKDSLTLKSQASVAESGSMEMSSAVIEKPIEPAPNVSVSSISSHSAKPTMSRSKGNVNEEEKRKEERFDSMRLPTKEVVVDKPNETNETAVPIPNSNSEIKYSDQGPRQKHENIRSIGESGGSAMMEHPSISSISASVDLAPQELNSRAPAIRHAAAPTRPPPVQPLLSQPPIVTRERREIEVTAEADSKSSKTATSSPISQKKAPQSVLFGDVDLSSLRAQYVTPSLLNESLEDLKYDVHKEVQAILREQQRQFMITTEEMNRNFESVKILFQEMMEVNRELRLENDRLKKRLDLNRFV